MSYLQPDRARVTHADGTHEELDAEGAQQLFFSLPARAYRLLAGSEQRSLRFLGGRTTFERDLQRQLIRWLAEAERPGLKRVLIIGDSIRMRQADCTGYGLHAYRRLVGEFNLTHIPHNTGGSQVVLRYLDDWLDCAPDIVHWNAGLHDLAKEPGPSGVEEPWVPIDRYVENLQQIADRMSERGVSRIIWGLNTPVHDEWHQRRLNTGEHRTKVRYLRDVVAYNEASKKVMSEREIEITDLCTPLLDAGLERCLLPDGVHLARPGSQILGEVVAEQIRRFR